MSISNWCIVAACALPILTAGMAKAGTAGMPKKSGGYDNNNPREWASHLSGWQARAIAAQYNGFEALPLFIAAVVLAQQVHLDQGRIDGLAMAFVAIRVVYVATYVMNLGTLRSLVWTAGFATCVALIAMT